MSRLQLYIIGLLCMGVMAFGISGCNRPGPAVSPAGSTQAAPGTSPAAGASAAPTAAASPTAEPEPLALKVNDYGITQAEYRAWPAMYQLAAGGGELTADQKQAVLDDLTDQALLAQAAQENGFSVDAGQVQQKVDELASKVGGEAALQSWMQANGFDAETFRQALARQMAAAWMRDKIIAETPTAAEQVHARQILLYTAEDAADVLGQLKAGNDFGNLAIQYDPVTRGDLGWFPRGYLTDPKLDDVVFNLQVNQYSDIIQTSAGYHILQVLERADQRPLSPEALLLIQARAIQDWLTARRSQVKIETLQP